VFIYPDLAVLLKHVQNHSLENILCLYYDLNFFHFQVSAKFDTDAVCYFDHRKLKSYSFIHSSP